MRVRDAKPGRMVFYLGEYYYIEFYSAGLMRMKDFSGELNSYCAGRCCLGLYKLVLKKDEKKVKLENL